MRSATSRPDHDVATRPRALATPESPDHARRIQALLRAHADLPPKGRMAHRITQPRGT